MNKLFQPVQVGSLTLKNFHRLCSHFGGPGRLRLL